MSRFLIKLIEMSMQAAVMVCAVLVFRALFRRLHLSAKYSLFLWIFPFFCMMCPWRVESPIALFPAGETAGGISLDSAWTAGKESVADESAFGEVQGEILPGAEEELGQTMTETAEESRTETGEMRPDTAAGAVMSVIDAVVGKMAAGLMPVFFFLWLAGFTGVCIYSLLSILRLRRKLLCSLRINANVYLADDVEAPFIFGLVRPRIYLPSALSKAQEAFVLEHERTHIRRKDHLLKAVVFILVGVHWFNPFAWIAFAMFTNDMELVCDEETIRRLRAGENQGKDIAKEYAQILMELSVGQKRLARIPIAFGEGNIKRRMQNVMKNRKPVFGAAAAAVCLIAVLAVAAVSKGREIEDEPQELVTLNMKTGSISATMEDSSAHGNAIPEDAEQEIVITWANASGEQPIIGADGTSLDYGDEDKIIFHDYYGLFVYSITEEKMLASVSLKDIGCGYTQGDRACELLVTDDGEAVYLHPMDISYLYHYDVEEGRLFRKAYSADEFAALSEKKFYKMKDTGDCLDPDYTVFRSSQCVTLSGGYFLYLESGSGLAEDLYYVIGKNEDIKKKVRFFDTEDEMLKDRHTDSFRQEGVTVISQTPSWAEQNAAGTMEETTGTQEALGSAETEDYSQKEQEEEEKKLLQEYAKYGVTKKGDAMYYHGERIRVFFDGYLITDENGSSTSNISRYQHYDKEGTANVRVVRVDTVNPDGTVRLFGELVDIVPYSEEMAAFVEKQIGSQ